jgi:hypothetical protein
MNNTRRVGAHTLTRTKGGTIKVTNYRGNYVTGKNRTKLLKTINIEELFMNTTEGKLKAARAIYNGVSKTDDPAEELFDAHDEEDNALVNFLPKSVQADFKKKWRDLASKQIFNGSFLEFQGMRFSDKAKVYDAERNDADGGREVFEHILGDSEKEKIYLKCRFSFDALKKDDTRVRSGHSATWASLSGKGKNSVEPDVIVRVGNEIRIFELKMGLGKKETRTDPKECHQLMRCKRLFEIWADEWNYELPKIKLYFVGWAAPSDDAVEFGESPLMSEDYKIKKINSEGMARMTSINAKLVSAIILELDRKRIKAFTSLINKFIKPWGPYYNVYRAEVNKRKAYIKSISNKYREAINMPPRLLQVQGAGKPQTGVEPKLRKRARNVVNNPNSNSNSTSPNSRRRRIAYNLKRLGVSNENIMKKINISRSAAINRARTIVQSDPEVQRLQAQLRSVSPARSNAPLNIFGNQ